MTRLTIACCLLGSLLCTTAAHAQTSGDDAARRAYDEGRALFTEGRYAEACPKLEASLALARDLRTHFGLADCYEKLGRLASAWREFEAVGRAAAEAGNAEQQKFAEGRARALEPRLIRLTLTVAPESAALPGFELRRNGARVEPDAWGKSIAIDPGKHGVEARADRHHGWSREIDATGEGTSLSLDVPVLEAEAPPPPPPSPPLAKQATPVAKRQSPPSTPPGKTQRFAGIIVGAAGVATLGAGVITGLYAKSRFDESAGHCEGNTCDDQGLAIREQAYDRGNIATVLSVVGGTLAVSGVVLYLTAPSGVEQPRVAVGASARGARVRLSW